MERNPCPDIPMTVQFCSVLNFYASGSYQRRVASDAFASMSQSNVSKCIRKYSTRRFADCPLSIVPFDRIRIRKSFHALNTQFVCDIRMRFLSANARYPGSTHDSLIWRGSLVNSTLKRIYNAMELALFYAGGQWLSIATLVA